MYPKYNHAFIALSSFCALLLAGCGTYDTTHVDRVNQLPAIAESKTFTVRPDASVETDDMFPYMAKLVANKLTAYGWQVVAEDQNPDYHVCMGYSNDLPKLLITDHTNEVPEPTSRKYSTMLQLGIVEEHPGTGMPPTTRFEGSVKCRGSVVNSIPSMIDELFTNFPGESGQTKTVSKRVSGSKTSKETEKESPFPLAKDDYPYVVRIHSKMTLYSITTEFDYYVDKNAIVIIRKGWGERPSREITNCALTPEDAADLANYLADFPLESPISTCDNPDAKCKDMEMDFYIRNGTIETIIFMQNISVPALFDLYEKVNTLLADDQKIDLPFKPILRSGQLYTWY